jgi:hypothetical protein
MAPLTTTEERICRQGIRCRHRGLPISIDQSIILEKTVLFHIVIFFIKHATIVAPLVEQLRNHMHFQDMFHRPSPPGVPKKKCRKCKRRWSLSRIIDNTGEQCLECEFCRGSNQSLLFYFFFLIHKTSINNLNDLKLLSRAIQILFFILLHLTPLALMDLHLPRAVHFPDSGRNLHHRRLNVSTIQTEIYIVIYNVLFTAHQR